MREPAGKVPEVQVKGSSQLDNGPKSESWWNIVAVPGQRRPLVTSSGEARHSPSSNLSAGQSERRVGVTWPISERGDGHVVQLLAALLVCEGWREVITWESLTMEILANWTGEEVIVNFVTSPYLPLFVFQLDPHCNESLLHCYSLRNNLSTLLNFQGFEWILLPHRPGPWIMWPTIFKWLQ